MSEPCESTLFSYYVNVDGRGFGCSFSEGIPEYKGIDVVNCNDFIEDVWMHPETVAFRNKCIANKDKNNCRMCHIYNLGLDN